MLLPTNEVNIESICDILYYTIQNYAILKLSHVLQYNVIQIYVYISGFQALTRGVGQTRGTKAQPFFQRFAGGNHTILDNTIL